MWTRDIYIYVYVVLEREQYREIQGKAKTMGES